VRLTKIKKATIVPQEGDFPSYWVFPDLFFYRRRAVSRSVHGVLPGDLSEFAESYAIFSFCHQPVKRRMCGNVTTFPLE
jgi:hypothetical protein